MEFKEENADADANGADGDLENEEDIADDTESEMIVMQQSDSMSSMGSTFMRIDSSTNLPQTISSNNLHGETKTKTNYSKAAGAMTTFMVNEDDENNSSDEESVLQRADDAQSQSDAASFVVRAEASDDESVIQRADNYDASSYTGSARIVRDDYSDTEESIMQRANEAQSDATSAMMVRAADDDNSEMSESVMEVVERPGVGDGETSQSESQL